MLSPNLPLIPLLDQGGGKSAEGGQGVVKIAAVFVDEYFL